MDAIRLHWFWSTNPQKIRFALNELGLKYTLEFVDLRKAEQKQPAFLKLNPRAKVPVLEIDGTVLWGIWCCFALFGTARRKIVADRQESKGSSTQFDVYGVCRISRPRGCSLLPEVYRAKVSGQRA